MLEAVLREHVLVSPHDVANVRQRHLPDRLPGHEALDVGRIEVLDRGQICQIDELLVRLEIDDVGGSEAVPRRDVGGLASDTRLLERWSRSHPDSSGSNVTVTFGFFCLYLSLMPAIAFLNRLGA